MNDDLDPDELEPEPYVPSLLEADLFPDDVAAWAASVDPGSAPITPLATVDLARLSAGGRVDALVATDKHIAWLQARKYRLLAEMAAAPVVAVRSGSWTKNGSVRMSPARCGSRRGMRRTVWPRPKN